jgi:putative acetyltransferase
VVSIRAATAEDSSGILACLSAAFEQYRGHYTAGAFADTVLTAETIVKRFQQMTVYVAVEESGEIVGTIACGVVSAEEGHIRGMAVVPGLRGSDVASRLLKRAESYFQERNCNRISLGTTAPLKRAIRFYERAGFRPTGRIQDFFDMPLHEYTKVI